MIAIRGKEIRTIQVKATAGRQYGVPNQKKKYDILAAVRLVGENREVYFDQCEIFLLRKEELAGRSRSFSQIGAMKLDRTRIDVLFPPEISPNQSPRMPIGVTPDADAFVAPPPSIAGL